MEFLLVDSAKYFFLLLIASWVFVMRKMQESRRKSSWRIWEIAAIATAVLIVHFPHLHWWGFHDLPSRILLQVLVKTCTSQSLSGSNVDEKKTHSTCRLLFPQCIGRIVFGSYRICGSGPLLPNFSLLVFQQTISNDQRLEKLCQIDDAWSTKAH